MCAHNSTAQVYRSSAHLEAGNTQWPEADSTLRGALAFRLGRGAKQYPAAFVCSNTLYRKFGRKVIRSSLTFVTRRAGIQNCWSVQR